MALSAASFTAGAQTVSWSPESVQIESAASSWTRMVQLKDGSWLAAYMVAPSPSAVRVKRSFDSMRTWVWMSEVRESGRDLDNANLYQRPDGVILLAMRSVVNGRSYRISVYQSVDDGNSWQFLSTADSNETASKPGGLWEPFLLGLPDGRIACFYANETHSIDKPAYSQILSERISTDGGATWGLEIFAVAKPGAARPGEPNIAQTADGYLLFYEVCGTENCAGHTSYSNDGISWPGNIGPAIPNTLQDAQGVAMESGLLLAVSNERELMMSGNKGAAWIDTGTHPFAYGSWPALYRISPAEIAMVITGGGDNGEAGEYVRFAEVESAMLQPRPRIQLPIRIPGTAGLRKSGH
jgi:hypothetical protein